MMMQQLRAIRFRYSPLRLLATPSPTTKGLRPSMASAHFNSRHYSNKYQEGHIRDSDSAFSKKEKAVEDQWIRAHVCYD